MEWLAFFGCIFHEHFDEVKEALLSYPNEGWIISKEISPDAHHETNGEHMHFLVKMSKDDYHKFANRIFKKRFCLRGRAIKDSPRQYGRVKHIENLERMKAYTLKDGHFETNMTEAEIEPLQQLAHEENQEARFKKALMKHLQDNYKDDPYSDNGLSHHILNFYITHGEGRDPSRSAVERYSRIFITYFSSLFNDAKVNYLKQYL